MICKSFRIVLSRNTVCKNFFYMLYGFSGMMIAAMIYARIPPPAAKLKNTIPSLTNVGSILKYSPIPEQTPASILLDVFLYNLFSIVLSSVKMNFMLCLCDKGIINDILLKYKKYRLRSELLLFWFLFIQRQTLAVRLRKNV